MMLVFVLPQFELTIVVPFADTEWHGLQPAVGSVTSAGVVPKGFALFTAAVHAVTSYSV
jgi:hypothetical protein